MKHSRRLLLAAAGTISLVAAAVGVSSVAMAAPPVYSVATLDRYGGEPSIVSDSTGRLYDTSPSLGTVTYRSDNLGTTWIKTSDGPDPSSGDNCLATDQMGSVYMCNLNGSAEALALQADVWKSKDQGVTWSQGQGILPGSVCAASCSVFGVDRDWVAASIPAFSDTDHALVVLMYHDFYGPSEIWVNISTDGGATYGAARPVLATAVNGDPTTAVKVGANTFCNTVPAGVAIAPPGTPHAGRIFVAWIAADPVQNASGCNVSMFQSFHNFFLSYSDNGGLTWTAVQAWDALVGHDASTPFVAFTIDNQGNPYFAATINLKSDSTCATKTGAALQSATKCEYDAYLIWSGDGGSTWSRPYRVSPLSETGTHQFPTLSVGDPGNVIVGYLRTTYIEPTDPFGKFLPGGCAGSNTVTGAVGPCPWNLYAAQSVNLRDGPSGATWAVTQITTTPMHVGDICNLGIACIGRLGSNRHLLDFNMSALDPRGCNHIAFADDNTVNKLQVANQTSNCLPNSGQTVCHEGDGGGNFHGSHGDGSFTFDSDGCLDCDQNSVDSNNRGDGKDFHATRIDDVVLDSSGTTATITGLGTSGGVPVSFVFVAVQSTPLTPGAVTFRFSDGFSNSGSLTSGAISLH
jgi:hypothetical protein